VLLFISSACSTTEQEVPFYSSPDFTPLWLSSGSFNPDTLHKINTFSFINQNSQTITSETFKNKIYVANFFFTICPSICPRMTANLQKVAEAFKDDPNVLFISHSVTPEIDSVQKLQEYGDEHGIDATRWHLITGKTEDIYTLARQSYFVEEEIGFTRDNKEFLHTEHFILVDEQGHIRGLYNGTLELEAERLIKDIRLLRSNK
jgi:protein SCO1/2